MLPSVRSTWIARGQRLRTATPGQSPRRTLLDATAMGPERSIWTATRSPNSADFCAFLEEAFTAGAAARLRTNLMVT